MLLRPHKFPILPRQLPPLLHLLLPPPSILRPLYHPKHTLPHHRRIPQPQPRPLNPLQTSKHHPLPPTYVRPPDQLLHLVAPQLPLRDQQPLQEPRHVLPVLALGHQSQDTRKGLPRRGFVAQVVQGL